jgi:hypothetical protein
MTYIILEEGGNMASDIIYDSMVDAIEDAKSIVEDTGEEVKICEVKPIKIVRITPSVEDI